MHWALARAGWTTYAQLICQRLAHLLMPMVYEFVWQCVQQVLQSVVFLTEVSGFFRKFWPKFDATVKFDERHKESLGKTKRLEKCKEVTSKYLVMIINELT